MREKFIRFKDIPDNEISGIYDGDLGRVGNEIGVSCYEFVEKDGCFKIIMSSLSSMFLNDLDWFIFDFKSGEIPAYLIEAEKIGTGTYNEPVVKNIKIVHKLGLKELMVPEPSKKLDRTNPQFVIIG